MLLWCLFDFIMCRDGRASIIFAACEVREVRVICFVDMSVEA